MENRRPQALFWSARQGREDVGLLGSLVPLVGVQYRNHPGHSPGISSGVTSNAVAGATLGRGNHAWQRAVRLSCQSSMP